MSFRSGFSLLELIITMMIIMVMVGGAVVYYSDVVEQARRDKAHSDLRQLVKVIAQYESTLPGPLTTYADISEDPTSQDLRGLVALRLMPSVPADPWHGEYRIDLSMGIISSAGPDGVFDYVSPDSPRGDDIFVRFRPVFTVNRAMIDSTGHYIEVDFSRPVDFASLDYDTFLLEPAAATQIRTAVVDIVRRYRIRLFLESPPDPPDTNLILTVFADHVTAEDEARMPGDVVTPVIR